jgi:hypothetical protein
MASIDKVSIPQLEGENWSIWKAKFQALLEYKGLQIAIEQPESTEGKKASGQAKALMILHTADAYVKLLIGEPTAAKAWKKLEENFEKKSNARVIQLRKKLTSMKLMGRQTIAEYLGEIHEIKVDLEAAGQTVSDMELAVHALNGLPEEYTTLVEILEMGETELNLDIIQPKLMQREQKRKLQAEIGAAEEELEDSKAKGVAAAYAAKMEGSSKGQGRAHLSRDELRNSSNEWGRSSELRGRSSETRTCYGCGKAGHIKAECGFRDAECESCGKRGHTEAVCRAQDGAGKTRFAGVAFTAWQNETQPEAWIVDSGSTQHITADRRQFTSYRKLVSSEKIKGIGGQPLRAVGVGEVQLECTTPEGPCVVTLREVRHVPEAKANLFALRRATDAGAKIVLEGAGCRFQMGGVVKMQAIQQGALWKIKTVGEHTAYVAQGPAKRDRAMGEEKQAEKKPVKVVEIDLDSDDEEEQPVRKIATAEAVGATAKESDGNMETGRPGETEKGAERRYPSRARNLPGEWFRANMAAGVQRGLAG